MYEQYRHISNARGSGGGVDRRDHHHQVTFPSASTVDDSFSINQLLATSYCFCSLLLTIIQSPLQAEEEKKVSSNSSTFVRFNNRLDLEKNWKDVNNSLSLVCREEVYDKHSSTLILLTTSFRLTIPTTITITITYILDSKGNINSIRMFSI